MALEKIILFDKYVSNLVSTNNSLVIWISLAISFSIIIFGALALFYFWFAKKDKQTSIKLVVGTALLYVFVQVVKILVARPRPIAEASYSFPSTHTAIAFFLALILPVDKKIKVGLIFWASLVAVCRLLLGKHWLTDVIAGALFGALFAYFTAKLKIDKIKFFKL